MDPKLRFALFLVSFIFAVCATLGLDQHPRFNWLAAALGTFVLVFLIEAWKAV